MNDKDFPKAYEAKQYEDEIYAAWQESGFFNPDNLPGERKEAFSIVLPPPNVTGTLHIGHAVMLAIEDVMTRYARMSGKKALWLPGTDHAAIATQSKVEKILYKEEGKTRHDLGREEFLARVEKFAQDSHDTIVNQTKKMGASVDWSREAYTLDDARHQAVNTAFKRMYDDGLIYRGYRVVNWDPVGQTTVSDDEVVHEDTKAKFYTFKYSEDCPITIATTRPETKLGDTAIAVNPNGKWKKFIGQEFDLDFVGVKLHLKVIGDEEVDESFGTGALGVTPAHSVIDSEIAARHDLPLVQVIDEDAKMTKEAGPYQGLTTLDARQKIVEKLEATGLLENEEEIEQNLSVAERSGGIIEPLPKLQWFIDVNKQFKLPKSNLDGIKAGQEVSLKELMQTVVKSKQINIIPDRFNKIYFGWVDNLRDWNISRQIWFGHRMPVWYKDDEIHIGAEAPAGEGWKQDPDTLDTWFSSGLWTFSTLGWPNETSDLKTFHPTTVLETAYDIIFFWVARMILMTTYLLGDVPFENVYLHGLIRDQKGRKMSKSLDNTINPLDTIEKYGADATRLSLLVGSTPGNDTKISEEKIAGYRNFTNKLWNISRFILTSVDTVQQVGEVKPRTLADEWILSQFSRVAGEVTKHLEKYEFSQAGEKLRDFTWNEFADWYLEIAKVQREEEGDVTDSVLLYILERLLVLWHPFMPFVTEEIWKRFESGGPLMIHDWVDTSKKVKSTVGDFEIIKETIVAIRNIRSIYKIEPAKKLDLRLVTSELEGLVTGHIEIIKKLARIENIVIERSGEKTADQASAVVDKIQIFIPLGGLVDLEKEKVRLSMEIDDLNHYLHSTEQKLNNENFTKNAPASVVDEMKEKHAEAQKKHDMLKEQINGF